jgi:hypothetical protein
MCNYKINYKTSKLNTIFYNIINFNTLLKLIIKIDYKIVLVKVDNKQIIYHSTTITNTNTYQLNMDKAINDMEQLTGKVKDITSVLKLQNENAEINDKNTAKLKEMSDKMEYIVSQAISECPICYTPYIC